MEIIALFVFIVVALLGWGCAVFHEKLFVYRSSEDDKPNGTHNANAAQKELSLRDILKTNSIKGYQSV